MPRAKAFKIGRGYGRIWGMEIDGLKERLSRLEAPRRTEKGNIRHKLEDIIIIGLCTLVCKGEDFPDMEEFGKQREEWLKKFLELPHGIPSKDTFRRLFERLTPEALSECLYDWLGCHWEEDRVIAIDGKTIRGSKSESHRAYHVVSAFVAENQLVLGELVTEEKSNEITAVPELVDSLNIENSIVTADAMSCQKEIVKKIQEGKADYVIGLKGNQPALLENTALYFEHYAKELPCKITREKDHGRIEKREYRLLTDLSWLEEQEDWTGLKALGMVKSTVIKNEKTSTDIRYFISSVTDLDRFAYAVRKHWAIENQLHWSLDVIFEEDSCKAKKDMSPLNLNVLRKTALALCKHADFGRKVSIQK
ncbi:MAG: ISAs1 family transposase [Acetatifactor sp.]|nr:ISAs1 family transposase [Acetatifactor sp.]